MFKQKIKTYIDEFKSSIEQQPKWKVILIGIIVFLIVY